MNNTNNSEPTGMGPRRPVILALTVLLTMAISGGLFFWGRQPEVVAELKSYGYLGAFLISLIGNVTLLLPGVVLPILSGLGIVLYPAEGLAGPVMVGVLGGLGAGLGEIVGYVVGQTGRGIIKDNRMYFRLVVWMKRWGGIVIFVVSMVPFFFDLVGIAAGILRYPFWKFFLACWLGRTLLYIVFIGLAALGWEAVLGFFS